MLSFWHNMQYLFNYVQCFTNIFLHFYLIDDEVSIVRVSFGGPNWCTTVLETEARSARVAGSNLPFAPYFIIFRGSFELLYISSMRSLTDFDYNK